MSQRPEAVATGGVVHYNEPASPGKDSRGKPFVIRLVKMSTKAPEPITVPSRSVVYAGQKRERENSLPPIRKEHSEK